MHGCLGSRSCSFLLATTITSDATSFNVSETTGQLILHDDTQVGFPFPFVRAFSSHDVLLAKIMVIVTPGSQMVSIAGAGRRRTVLDDIPAFVQSLLRS